MALAPRSAVILAWSPLAWGAAVTWSLTSPAGAANPKMVALPRGPTRALTQHSSSWGLPGGYLIPHPGHVRFLEHKSASSTLRLQDFKFLGLGSEVVPFSLPLETLRGNKETPSPLSSLQFETFVLRGVLKQSIMTGYQVNTWNVSFSQSFGILTSIIWAHQSKLMLE